MRYIPTIFLSLLFALLAVGTGFLITDGNLARLTGWYRFEKGGQLFEGQTAQIIEQVDWMRVQDLHSTLDCRKEEDGSWWIIKPYRDRMSPSAVNAILAFTQQTRLVDTLPLNNTTKRSLREFGVETRPYTIFLKRPRSNAEGRTNVARYTLGSQAPWYTDSHDGQQLLPTCYLRTDFYGRDKRIHVVSGNILPIFKNGLSDLRDLNPFKYEPDSVHSLQLDYLNDAEKSFSLQRISAETNWTISAPITTSANQDKANKLLNDIFSLKAIHIKDKKDVPLDDQKPCFQISLTTLDGKKTSLQLYPESYDENLDAMVQYAVVSDRDVVFTLPFSPRVRRKGDYATIIQEVFKLPVLPEAALAKIRTGNTPVYAQDLYSNLDSLRSSQFTTLDKSDIARVALRSRYAQQGLRLLLIPGDALSQVKDQWMYSIGETGYKEAENAHVLRLLEGLGSIPIEGVVYDMKPGENEFSIMSEYGLDVPDYVLSVLPNPCALRSALFGQDISLIKDRPAVNFYFKRYNDKQAGESYWIAYELGSASIFRISSKLMRCFSLLDTSWKKKQILRFTQASLRQLKMDFQEAPLVLQYDYIGESWTGTLNGKDISPNINPYRAQHYIRHLQQMQAHQWLDPRDEAANKALAHPVFKVGIELEISKVVDQEALVIDAENNVNASVLEGETRKDRVERLLDDNTDDARDEAMRNTAFAEYETETKLITIEIAPMQAREDTMFYGRILETGELFILTQVEALSLANSILDL